MEKKQQLDGGMLDDLTKLVEDREKLHHSQTAGDGDSRPNTIDSPDAGQSGARSIA
jgi:hypothetical protein